MASKRLSDEWRSTAQGLMSDGSEYAEDFACGHLRCASQFDERYPAQEIERHEDVPICRRCGRCHVQSHWQTERLRLVHDGGSAVSLEYFDKDNDEWSMADDMDAKELRALGSAVLAMADILEETEVCNG